MVSIISCKWCKDQYIASACKNNFKPRFRVHKSNINTIKGRCGVAKHFLTKCTDIGKLWNIEVHLIKQVEEGNYDVQGKLWCRENYLQAKLLSLSHSMNSNGTGTALIEKVTAERKSNTICIFYCKRLCIYALISLSCVYKFRQKGVASIPIGCLYTEEVLKYQP